MRPEPERERAVASVRRRRRRAALAATVLVAGLAGGTAMARVLPGDGARRSTDRVADTAPPCDKGHPRPPSEPIPRGPDYPTNAAGQTYGSAVDNSLQPDLLAAVGDCGRTGYVVRDRLEEPPPWVPGAGSTAPRSTPVLESDGVTQIDTFTRAPGTTVADGVTSPPVPVDGPDAVDVQGDWTARIAGVGAGAGDEPGCERSAPLTAILDNVRHVTRSGARTYLHLADFRIAVVLTPRD